MKYKAILFDVDGTLLDTTEYIYQSFEYALKTHHTEQSRDLIKKIMGVPLEDGYKILTELEDVEHLMTTHRTFQVDNISLSKPFPHTLSTLEKLHAGGLQIAAVTNRAHKSVQETLDAAGLSMYINYLVAFDDVENPKPHPEPLLKALTYFDLKPDDVLMVGDSDVDVLAGKNAGVKTVGANYGFHKDHIHLSEPDYLIEDIKELLNLI